MKGPKITVRALRTRQGVDVDVFAFFLPGDQVAQIADITRLRRGEGQLEGFQRKEIRAHVSEIAEFLSQGPVLFPNAIILALSPQVRFKSARGPAGEDEAVRSGELHIPIRPEGQRAAWIVDGQQRSLALARAKQADLPVPIVAFLSDDTETQRAQFILVNKAKPLSPRLIDELLPSMAMVLPKSLKARQLPSALCAALADTPGSPLKGMIKRESQSEGPVGVITDSGLTKAIAANLRPAGALGAYDPQGGMDAAFQALCTYWGAVRDAFPDAWGKSSEDSRLMHTAGIQAMGALMDPIWTRADASADPDTAVAEALARIAPRCAWTEGQWDGLGWGWGDIQATSKHIKGLTEHLLKLDRELSRPAR
ncbi:DGQHR domain-containing protein [Brevundimonas sp. UYEF29]|uniref:DGQHR domain-containing protein DpdB n=1 Tax=Brevundimonas TaxID=41275 RepID=UPI003399BAF2